MPKKRGFIGPFNMGALRSIPTMLDSASKVTGRRAPEVHTILLASVFQAGLDEFVASNEDMELIPALVLPNFLRERFVQPNLGSWHEKATMLSDAFSAYLPENYGLRDEFAPVTRVESFLADLLYALEEDVSIMSIMDPPNEVDLRDLLPVELFIPIRNILSSFTEESVDVPIPRMTTGAEAVERYQAVLNSDLFTQYSKAHLELDFVETSVERALQHVSSIGQQLRKRAKEMMRSTRARLAVLSLAPPLIETAFGQLPGKAAEALLNSAEKSRAGRRRIVVYRLEGLMTELVFSSLVGIFKR